MSMQILMVAAGGATGAVSRFLVSVMMRASGTGGFPWATFGVNLAGCLLMGVLGAWLWRVPPDVGETTRLFVGVGLLGGFTTFSAFSLELFQLIERRDVWAALGYAGGSLVGGLLAFALGFYLARAVAS
jgi:CrcB protein